MEKIVIYTNPASEAAEAYRTLCTNVLAGQVENRIIEIASVSEKGNAGLIAVNLAAAVAEAGKNVLVVDCDLREPKLHDFFALQNRGLKECVLTGESYKSFVQATPQSKLFVLAAGSMVVNPLEILLSDAMQYILIDAKESYSIVLLLFPPVNIVSDAVALGNRTDGVLLVLTNKQDKVEQVLKVKDMFIQAGVNILGCVLDKV